MTTSRAPPSVDEGCGLEVGETSSSRESGDALECGQQVRALVCIGES
mgnify:CR=1 FL=1